MCVCSTDSCFNRAWQKPHAARGAIFSRLIAAFNTCPSTARVTTISVLIGAEQSSGGAVYRLNLRSRVKRKLLNVWSLIALQEDFTVRWTVWSASSMTDSSWTGQLMTRHVSHRSTISNRCILHAPCTCALAYIQESDHIARDSRPAAAATRATHWVMTNIIHRV